MGPACRRNEGKIIEYEPYIVTKGCLMCSETLLVRTTMTCIFFKYTEQK